MAGELTIQQNTDGTATINFPGGGSHTVGQAGDNITDNVSALQDAYGDRIGNVTSSDDLGLTTSNIPAWVDPDYGYDVNNPRKPNMREMMEMIAGKTVEEIYASGEDYSDITKLASNLLYGSVGSNQDTRDFVAITNAATNPTTGQIDANKFVAATQIATSQMYGGTTVKYQPGGYQTDEAGNTVIGNDGKPALLDPALYVVGGNGTILTSLSTNAEQMASTLQNFGVQDTSWIDTVSSSMGNALGNYQFAFDTLKETYNPYVDYQDLFNVQGLTTGVAPTIDNLQVVSGQTISGTGTGTETEQVGTKATQVTGDQTQKQAQTDAVSMAANQAIVTPQQLPQTVSYQMPQGYQGSGFIPSYTGTTTTMQTPTMTPMTGTFTKPVGSSMLNYQPSQQYTIGQTTAQTPQMFQAQQAEVRMYRNDSGMTTSITFINGKPQTPIPSGFYPVGQQPAGQTQYQPQVSQVQAPTPTSVTPYTPQFNMNQGGIVPPVPTSSGNRFGGFRPEAMQRIAQNLGYSGDMNGFDQYLNDNPDKKEKMNNYNTRAKQMAEGGMVQKFNPGGSVASVSSGGTGPDAYIGSTDDPVFQVVNPGPASGIPIVDMSNTASNVTTGTSVEQQMPQSITVPLQQYDPRVLNQQYIPQQPDFTGQNITEVQAGLAKTPGLPTGATVVPTGTQLTAGQLVSPYSGQVAGSLALPTALASTEQAMMPMTQQAALASPIEASGAVSATVDQTQAAQLQQVAAINAAQQQTTSVSGLSAAQGTGILMDNPVQRQIQEGELISGAANAETAAKFNEEIQAATATPTKQATVQGQLETLMAQFEGGNTPAWAAGSMRNATAILAARGLGASSMAGQAVIQASMEAALPIAQMDAQVQAQFEGQNLSNRQQRAMLAAQQRAQFLGQEFDQEFQSRVANAAKVSDVANMNFTAEQQVALENSRIANTMELTNLSNSQAMVLAEASALANMDMANLNNRQQAAVQNAQNFLQADLTNLSNQQQTELFKAQQRVQSLFTDQAALNAAQQFNASSENQVSQFFASLQSNTSQFNAAQANAQGQFNAGQVNVIERFNAEINNQRDQFNAQNRLIIDQSNAQWRREIATADTLSVNRANEVNAQSLLGYSQQAYNNLWQYYADNMEWAWTSAENERQRYMNLTVAKMQQDTSITLAKAKEDYESSSSFGGLIGKVLTSDLSNTLLGGIFG
jgi:hypothetical protein